MRVAVQGQSGLALMPRLAFVVERLRCKAAGGGWERWGQVHLDRCSAEDEARCLRNRHDVARVRPVVLR